MTTARRSTFALCFGNRGLFPASLIASARDEVSRRLREIGHETLLLPLDATRYGAVETKEEGRVYARFLQENRGRFQGVILSLPNFGDETGAAEALQGAGVPILIQAYPDDLDKMAPALRRDSFCGKFSIMDVFRQYGIPFTALKPHVVGPSSAAFAENVEHFDRICRVVAGMRGLVVGAIGARTTAFKTVRIDELALQRHGITVETLDLSDIFLRVEKLNASDPKVAKKRAFLESYTRWDGVPEAARSTIARLGVVLDDVIEEFGLHALSLRCWVELERRLGISPCVALGDLNDRGIASACEVDVGSAVTMHALRLASGNAPACLDWNNNYGDEEDKCILFHCGPLPQSLMAGKGLVTDHAIISTALGPGCSYGCNTGRIAPNPFTYGNLMTEDGKLRFYLGQGRFTSDPIPQDFFGVAGVAEIRGLQEVLLAIGLSGHRHHVALTAGHVAAPVFEALTRYLGYEVARFE